MSEEFISFIKGLSPRDAPKIFFILSLDGIFLWCCAFAFGDRQFSIIDWQSIAQMQFRILGFGVVSWAISSILSGAFRLLLNELPIGVFRRSSFRRIFRFVKLKFALELSIFVYLFTALLLNSALLPTATGILILTVNRFGYLAGRKSRTSYDRHARKKVDAPTALIGLRASISMYDREIERTKYSLETSAKLFMIAGSALLGIMHAESLKKHHPSNIFVNEQVLNAVIVGRTSYGFLLWDLDDCGCLFGIEHNSILRISASSANLE